LKRCQSQKAGIPIEPWHLLAGNLSSLSYEKMHMTFAIILF